MGRDCFHTPRDRDSASRHRDRATGPRTRPAAAARQRPPGRGGHVVGDAPARIVLERVTPTGRFIAAEAGQLLSPRKAQAGEK